MPQPLGPVIGPYGPPAGSILDSGGGGPGSDTRNPLLCYVCNDYFTNPCLLQCFHTFCFKCLRGRDIDGRLSCPLCGNITILKEGSSLPSDNLMKQLIDLVNVDNPPCANCDKRDKNSMYFCSTCGQALCNPCRENTHRAKMFSAHDIVHVSKCSNDNQKKCLIHGEPYIMFNSMQKIMLCMTCFRDTPPETRVHCIDIETAYQQCGKKLDRAVVGVCEVQSSVKEGLLMVKTLLEELRRNMELEKHTINVFSQGMQDAIAKTHSIMVTDVQRQYDIKERSFRNQFVSLGTILPVIQLHLLLCRSFTNIANKLQFVDLAFPMIERLSAVAQLSQPQRPAQSSAIRTNYRNEFTQALEPFIGKSVNHSLPLPDLSHLSQNHPPPSKRQQNVLRVKAMEGEGPFSNHCRSFDNQVKELNQQLLMVKERLENLHRDIALLRRVQTPPLIVRYQNLTGDCAVLDQQLERHQVELERMKNVFDTLWEEQLCRIHVEQEIFQSQMNEILNLRGEVRLLATAAQQLEPHIKSLTNAQSKAHESQQLQELNLHSQQLQNILDHINMLQIDASRHHRKLASDGIFPKEIRSRPRTPSQPTQTGSSLAMLDSNGHVVIYEAAPVMKKDQQASTSRGMISQLIDKVRTKEDRKKSPERDRIGGIFQRERSKSDGRAEIIRAKAALDDFISKQPQPEISAKMKGKKDRYLRDGKKSSIYQSISGRMLGSKSEEVVDQEQLPLPPPPARRNPQQDPNTDIREKLEIHLREKLQEIMKSNAPPRGKLTRPEKSLSLDAQALEEYQKRIASFAAEEQTRALMHREPSSKPGSTATSPHRRREELKRERRGEWERSRESSKERKERRDRSRSHRDRSRDRTERRERSKDRRRDKYGRCYPASDPEEICYPDGFSRKRNSCESLTHSTVSVESRKSSTDVGGDRKTLVLVISGSKSDRKQRLAQKQRSWETFPPKKKNSYALDSEDFDRPGHEMRPASAQDTHKRPGLRTPREELAEGPLRKADSFEGHEEAVRTLVAAVHHTRSQQGRAKSTGHVSN